MCWSSRINRLGYSSHFSSCFVPCLLDGELRIRVNSKPSVWLPSRASIDFISCEFPEQPHLVSFARLSSVFKGLLLRELYRGSFGIVDLRLIWAVSTVVSFVASQLISRTFQIFTVVLFFWGEVGFWNNFWVSR